MSQSVLETENLGKYLAKSLLPGDFVALYGDLGIGKTAFVRGVASQLGDNSASSPTFGIVHEYDTEPPVLHFDVYRLHDEDDLEAIGYDDYMSSGSIVLMEWPERVPAALPTNRIEIHMQRGGTEHTRELLFSVPEKRTDMLENISRYNDEGKNDESDCARE